MGGRESDEEALQSLLGNREEIGQAHTLHDPAEEPHSELADHAKIFKVFDQHDDFQLPRQTSRASDEVFQRDDSHEPGLDDGCPEILQLVPILPVSPELCYAEAGIADDDSAHMLNRSVEQDPQQLTELEASISDMPEQLSFRPWEWWGLAGDFADSGIATTWITEPLKVDLVDAVVSSEFGNPCELVRISLECFKPDPLKVIFSSSLDGKTSLRDDASTTSSENTRCCAFVDCCNPQKDKPWPDIAGWSPASLFADVEQLSGDCLETEIGWTVEHLRQLHMRADVLRRCGSSDTSV